MAESTWDLVDWLDDLCVRFIINLPQEELESVERICFQIEEAQWFYEDFIRPLDPRLPSMNLRSFCLLIFQHCPLLSQFTEQHRIQAYEEFIAYKTRVPVRGAILLNEAMDQAVLVKGWRKGAKWSFPRGKINKEETDLDCAIREVYEETGFDIKAAGLVPPEDDAKYIRVSMREQDMRLYVFRGVPMDTYFEPRTRKEISKISWYKLSDLPTAKKNKQPRQGSGNDVPKDNMFYMVAPFLAPLKSWVKEQRRLDRARAKAGNQALPTAEPDASGPEASEAYGNDAQFGELTADETPSQQETGEPSFEQLVANLGRHRSSDALPEVSVQPTPISDPAEALKKMLSVGANKPTPAPVEAPNTADQQEMNPLLAMLRGNNNNRPPGPPPRTPFEQIIPDQPPPPQTPHYHHPRQQLPGAMPPPPPPNYPFQQQVPFRGPPPPAFQPPQRNKTPDGLRQLMGAPGVLRPIPPEAPSQGPPDGLRQLMGPPPPPSLMNRAPNVQQAFSQQAPRPFQQTGDPQFARPPSFPASGPVIPAASKLPPPKLTAHSLALLNTFKATDKPANTQITSPPPNLVSNETVRVALKQQVQTVKAVPESMVSPPSTAAQYVPSPPPAAYGVPSPMTLQAAPKPRSAHQDNLLNLFRASSDTVTTPPPIVHQPRQSDQPEPVELSAQATPGSAGRERKTPILPPAAPPPGYPHPVHPPQPAKTLKPSLLETLTGKPTLTSATVSGPLNAPDFETVKKQAKAAEPSGHTTHRESSVSPSPPRQLEMEQKKPFSSVQVLQNPNRGTRQRTPQPVNVNANVQHPVRQPRGPPTPKTQVKGRPGPQGSPKRLGFQERRGESPREASFLERRESPRISGFLEKRERERRSPKPPPPTAFPGKNPDFRPVILKRGQQIPGEGQEIGGVAELPNETVGHGGKKGDVDAVVVDVEPLVKEVVKLPEHRSPVSAVPPSIDAVPAHVPPPLPLDQKSVLLGLFNKPAQQPKPQSPSAVGNSIIPSAIISPVSPLTALASGNGTPSPSLPGTGTGTTANRSRISSFGDGIVPPTTTNALPPQIPQLQTQIQRSNGSGNELEVNVGALVGGLMGTPKPIVMTPATEKSEIREREGGGKPETPVDQREFLLGFLRGVARGGGGK